MAELRLSVLDATGRRRFDEELPAEPIGSGRYRLLGSPGLVQGLAAGDELELAPDTPAGFRILRRGGQLSLWVYLRDPAPADSNDRLSAVAATLGGYLDGGQAGLRILTVPAATGFPRIEAALDRAVADLAGECWATAMSPTVTPGCRDLDLSSDFSTQAPMAAPEPERRRR